MKKNLFLLICVVLSSGISLVHPMSDAADEETVAPPEAPAAMTTVPKENLQKMVKTELKDLGVAWDGAHSSDKEDAEVARQVADFCRTLAGSQFPGNKKSIIRKLQQQIAECDRHAAAFEGGHAEYVIGLEVERERLKDERAQKRASGPATSDLRAVDADLKTNLEELSKHVIGHLRGAASIYSHALLQVLNQVGGSLSQIKTMLGGASTVAADDDDDDETEWDEPWVEDEEAYESLPVVGEEKKRAVIAIMAGRALGELRKLREDVARLLESGAGRDNAHRFAANVVAKLPQMHEVAKKDASIWKDYFGLFAETETSDRLNAKTDAETGYHTARGRAAHLYLQKQRLESIAASLNELRGNVSNGAVYDRLMNELGKMKTGDVAASTLQLLVGQAEAIQRFTSTGPLRAPREDMAYRLHACKTLTPYIDVMNTFVAVLVSRLAPGVFTAGKELDGKAAERARDRHTAAAAAPKEAAPATEPVSPVDGASTASSASSTDGSGGDDDAPIKSATDA